MPVTHFLSWKTCLYPSRPATRRGERPIPQPLPWSRTRHMGEYGVCVVVDGGSHACPHHTHWTAVPVGLHSHHPCEKTHRALGITPIPPCTKTDCGETTPHHTRTPYGACAALRRRATFAPQIRPKCTAGRRGAQGECARVPLSLHVPTGDTGKNVQIREGHKT